MKYFVFLYGLFSFFVVLFITPWLIRYLKKIGLVVKDQNKESKPLVPISGGLVVLFGIMAGLMLFLFVRTFFSGFTTIGLVLNNYNLVVLFSAALSILTVTIIGFLDDLVIDKSHDGSVGLKQWQKPLLTLIAAVPLMVIKIGTTDMGLPFIGVVDFGIFYALILVPLGFVGSSNMVNMLAGFNGLETGMGIVYTGMLGLYAYVNQSYVAALIALLTFCSLLAFFIYTKSPAKILPGDSLTYLLGAVIAVIAIVGNLERAAIICSIPFILELILKSRARLHANNYGYYKNGKIMSLHGKNVYSLTHLFTRTGRFTENQIVYSFIVMELIISSLIWI
ncbi:MAG: hypothetical protein AABX19_02065 [Nanoarchaeota archaeon]